MQNLQIDLENIGAPFELSVFHADTAAEKESRKKATAIGAKTRHTARRIKAEATLAEILPAVIEQGESWHCISAGDVDALSYLAHLVKSTPMDYVAFSTWCMAMPDVAHIESWLTSGRIKKMDAYVGEIFPNQYADEYEKLCAVMQKFGGRVCVFRNHSKLFLCRSGEKAWVVESSANINTNPRTENTTITGNIEVFRHHMAYFNGVRSFNRNFDDWQPHEPA